jgi:hypothetical protein
MVCAMFDRNSAFDEGKRSGAVSQCGQQTWGQAPGEAFCTCGQLMSLAG